MPCNDDSHLRSAAGADSLDRNYKASDGQYNYFINVCTSVNGYNGDENPAVLQEEKTAQSGEDKRQVVLGQADEAGIKSYTYQSSTDISGMMPMVVFFADRSIDTDLVFTYPEGAVSGHKCPGETRAARIIYVCDDVGVVRAGISTVVAHASYRAVHASPTKLTTASMCFSGSLVLLAT